jgi:hypothetical protein
MLAIIYDFSYNEKRKEEKMKELIKALLGTVFTLFLFAISAQVVGFIMWFFVASFTPLASASDTTPGYEMDIWEAVNVCSNVVEKDHNCFFSPGLNFLDSYENARPEELKQWESCIQSINEEFTLEDARRAFQDGY